MSKEAMKLALEALKQIDEAMPFPVAKLAQAALREALAEQPAQKEPVAWMHVMDNTEGIKANGKGHISITQKRKHPFGKPGVDFSKSYPVTSTPLYTTPPAQRKPLTDMQVDGEWILVRDLDTNDVEKSRLFARAIEAAHGIKENT